MAHPVHNLYSAARSSDPVAESGYTCLTTWTNRHPVPPQDLKNLLRTTCRLPRLIYPGVILLTKTYNLRLSGLCLLVICLNLSTAYSQTAKLEDLSAAAYARTHITTANTINTPPPLPRPSPALIIREFIAAETKFRGTLTHFSFKRDVILQTIGSQGEFTGEYLRNAVFVLDDRGKRIERVLYHPKPTMKKMTITKEDIQDLAGSQLFGLELAELDSYNLAYLGEESLNGRLTYLIGVSPKQEPDPNHMRVRFFVGRVWIDATTFQPVKLAGTTEPHGKQRFPNFVTERNINIEDMLLPSSTSADEVLRFLHQDTRYRIKVRYYDFKRFASRLKIVELE